MRWGYKTVFFGLKKDGLLGSAFLDDAEIEVALNEYGRAGWELVSIFETRDGVIAVFKQPLGVPLTDTQAEVAPARRFTSTGRATAAAEPVIRQRISEPPRQQVLVPQDEPEEILENEPEPQYAVVDDEDALTDSMASDDEPALFPPDEDRTEDEDDDIGGIRIE